MIIRENQPMELPPDVVRGIMDSILSPFVFCLYNFSHLFVWFFRFLVHLILSELQYIITNTAILISVINMLFPC